MFENFSTALIQLVGFIGVFGFFIYQLLTDKKNGNSSNLPVKPKVVSPKKIEGKARFFGIRKKEVIEEPSKNKKNRWFN